MRVVGCRVTPDRLNCSQAEQATFAKLIGRNRIPPVANRELVFRGVNRVNVGALEIEIQMANPEIRIVLRNFFERLAHLNFIEELIKLNDLSLNVLVTPIGARIFIAR